MQSCKNKEGLSNASMDAILLTLFDLVFDFKKVTMKSAYDVHKWEENLYNKKKCK
jgi:hypothetical protein